MKLKELLAARKVICAHANEALPASLAYKLMKFMKQSDDEDAFYVQKAREILTAHNGDISKAIPASIYEECKDELAAVEGTDVAAPEVRFTIDELAVLQLTVTDMYALDAFIKEGGSA